MHISHPYKVGITGGIGTGKSTAVNYLKQMGYYIIDADTIAREVVEKGTDGLKLIVSTYGQGILNEDETLNRKRLGEIVFSSKDKLEALNKILHPLIRDRISFYEKQNDHLDVIFYDVPLLFETKQQHLYNEVLLIYASSSISLDRVVKRDGISESLANNKINAQYKIDVKKDLADFVVINDESIEALEEKIENYVENLKVRIQNWQKNNEY
ncbi:MAG: dephospho-CoA kinase [Clostridiales bacterium 38-18]|nr:MAG: dephospho-CoA kinase [Clostridiales bacterium 38-18]